MVQNETRSVAKSPPVAEQCDVNLHSLREALEPRQIQRAALYVAGFQWHQDSNHRNFSHHSRTFEKNLYWNQIACMHKSSESFELLPIISEKGD
ncbi:hypothetical protein TNCV_2130811 [Trichonephila clavipes]|nr:hypothetical protein TNCV_2130811 [Trichonephila clavipes]